VCVCVFVGGNVQLTEAAVSVVHAAESEPRDIGRSIDRLVNALRNMWVVPATPV